MRPLAVALASDEPAVLSICREALKDLGELRVLAPTRQELGRPVGVDLLILDLRSVEPDSVSLFRSCNAANDRTPIVLIAPDPGPDVATELLRLGAADFVVWPATLAPLRKKLRRVLTGVPFPASDHPALAQMGPRVEQDDRRGSFRALVAPGDHAVLCLDLDGSQVKAPLEDLALDGERAPGAMRLRVSSEDVPPASWMVLGREEVVADLDLEDDFDEPIRMRVRASRIRYSIRRRRVDVILQFRTEGGEDARRIGRFWIRCQQKGGVVSENPPAG